MMVTFLVPGWMMVVRETPRLRWPLCCCGWRNRAPYWRSSRWSAEKRAQPQATLWRMSHHPPKKVCFHCLTHHDACDADAHIADDVEFVVKEVLDARLTVLQSKSMSHAVRDGWMNISINNGLKCNLKFSQPTLVSGASVQGLPVVPQQFSWKCDKREVPRYILFSRLGIWCCIKELTIFWYDIISVLLLFSL